MTRRQSSLPVRRPTDFDLSECADAPEKYPTGSILRIRLRNFVTYASCDMHPGPYMNMVMGPNGTGKSSIVAAIAIGLGWHPAVLGRSRELAEYVKYGEEQAMIEIVLKCDAAGNPVKAPVDKKLPNVGDDSSRRPTKSARIEADGDENGEQAADMGDIETDRGFVVIRRHIWHNRSPGVPLPGDRSSFSSEFYVNDKQAAAKRVATLVRSFNIQIDNLCQFLPQDKVGEFSKMTPVELLVETQKAAADPAVHQQHQQLIEMQRQVRSLTHSIQIDTATRDQLVVQNEAIDHLVQRMQERDERKKRIALCKRKRPWLLYDEARDRFVAARQAYGESKQRFDEQTADMAPLRRQLEDARRALAAKQRSTRGDKSKRLAEEAERASDQLGAAVNECQKQRDSIKSMRRARAKQQAEISDQQQSLRQLEEDHRRAGPAPPPVDEAHFKQRMLAIDRQIEHLSDPLADTRAQQEQVRLESEQIRREINSLHRQMSDLEDERSRRLHSLREFYRPSHDALQWLEASRSQFRKRVYGPLCLEMTCDPSVATLVENVVAVPVLTSTFYCFTEADYELVMRELVDARRLPIHAVLMDASVTLHGSFRPDSAHARRFGFDGLAIEHVQADEPVLVALCESAGLHLVPLTADAKRFAGRDLYKDKQFRTAYHKYVTPSGRFELRINRYREGDDAINTHSIRPARFLASNANEGGSQDMLARVRRLQGEADAGEQRMKGLLAEEQRLREQVALLERPRRAIADELGEARRLAAAFDERQQLIGLRREKLRKAQAALASRLDEEPLKAELCDRLLPQRRTAVVNLLSRVGALEEALVPSMLDLLEAVHLRRRVATLQADLEEREVYFRNARAALATAEQSMQQLKERARDLLEAAQQDGLDQETRSAFEALPKTLAALDEVISQEEALLAFGTSSAFDARTLDDYDARRKQIAALDEQLAANAASLTRTRQQIASVRALWIPAVTAMTEQISARFGAFFAAIGCVGEVQLGQHGDDYDCWETAIMVKFRDVEQLQRLSAHRQSGGEKSVSTILYLLALQELSQSPFRVVDEINQGMDAVNERRIHSLVVDTATTSASSQYFLITPKLLTNLEYHPNMHIMCVFNGTRIPSSDDLRMHCCWSSDGRRRPVGNLELGLLKSATVDDELSSKGSDEASDGMSDDDEESMTHAMQDIEISTA